VRKEYLFTFVFGFLLLATGCVFTGEDRAAEGNGVTIHSSTQATELISSYIAHLCTPEFSGRAIGSAGNDRATEWIESILIGLDITLLNTEVPGISFSVDAPELLFSTMIITTDIGEQVTLEHGRDFFIALSDGDVDFKLSNPDSSSVGFLDISQSNLIGTVDWDLIFLEADHFRNNLTPNYREGVLVQLSSEAFGKMKAYSLLSVEIVNRVQYTPYVVRNIVGLIEGSNQDKVVVLTAHFDGVGSAGSVVFPGGLDNASGVSALLYIAQELKQVSVQSPFAFDIALGFCNAEEYGLRGSRGLAKVFNDRYKEVTVINLDCIGYVMDSSIAMGYCNSDQMKDNIVSLMSEHGIVYSGEDALPGDHMSFVSYGNTALLLCSPGFGSNDIHSTASDENSVSAQLVCRLSVPIRWGCSLVQVTVISWPFILL